MKLHENSNIQSKNLFNIPIHRPMSSKSHGEGIHSSIRQANESTEWISLKSSNLFIWYVIGKHFRLFFLWCLN